MSWGPYDELRQKLLEMSQATSTPQADELLIDFLNYLAMYLSIDFPSIPPMVDNVVAEWRKKRDA